jgi:hypothetical protein
MEQTNNKEAAHVIKGVLCQMLYMISSGSVCAQFYTLKNRVYHFAQHYYSALQEKEYLQSLKGHSIPVVKDKIKELVYSLHTLTVYNLARYQNPYPIYFNSEEGSIKGYKMSIFGQPIPTATYNFKF